MHAARKHVDDTIREFKEKQKISQHSSPQSAELCRKTWASVPYCISYVHIQCWFSGLPAHIEVIEYCVLTWQTKWIIRTQNTKAQARPSIQRWQYLLLRAKLASRKTRYWCLLIERKATIPTSNLRMRVMITRSILKHPQKPQRSLQPTSALEIVVPTNIWPLIRASALWYRALFLPF